MMQSIITNKLKQCHPDILIRPPVSRFRVLDFMKIDAVMAETASVKDEVKRAVEAAIAAREAPEAHKMAKRKGG
jgi:NTE family protein